jgi:hypothetical protein
MMTLHPSDSQKPPTLDSCWRKFERLFPTEEACVEELRRLLEMHKTCPACDNNIAHKIYGARFFKCRFCLKKRWLTARTFFHRSRRVRPWLAAIFLFEHGVAFNAFQLHKLVGVAYSTAFSILKKITIAGQSAMQERSILDVSSSLFVTVFTKRSRETPVRKQPVAEQDAIDVAINETGEMSGEPAEETEETKEPEPAIEDPVERAIYRCLSLSPTAYDALCSKLGLSAGELSAALTFMELSNLVKRLPGEQYVRSAAFCTDRSGAVSIEGPQRKLVDGIVDYIRNTFGGISRKYLQNYISMHWCQDNSKKQGKNSLLKLCLRFRNVSHKEIRDYVSPRLVQIALTEV